MKNKILLFLKGILMGICDLIPGVSGGTIAFITGIYARLINAVKSFNFKLIKDFVTGNKRELKKDIKRLDLGFLIVLFLGIIIAILIGSRIIKFLLDRYFVYTLSFFIGLILASCVLIFQDIKNRKGKNILFGVFGLIIGISLAFLIPMNIAPNLYYVFIGGFIAISAMFLPGISGAFILLIMGLYEFMLNILHNIKSNLNYFVVFIFGAILGAFVISRIISFLFKKNKCKTLYFLLGLVIGALGVPLKKIFEIAYLDISNVFFMISFVILGILSVVVVMWYKETYEKKLQKIEKTIGKVVE